jgi:hypothetical protein
MEKQDLYIKEALKILKHNNSYFKKVYSASQVETYSISINSNEYYFFVNMPEDDDKSRSVFETKIKDIPNVSILNSYDGQIRPPVAKPIESSDTIYDLAEDFDEITNIIKSLASTSSPEPEPESKSEPETIETEKIEDSPETKQFFIHRYEVKDRTKDAAPRTVTTSVTDRSLENFQLLLEFFGYIVTKPETIQTSTNPEELYQFVPNDAITPKNIKGAAGAILKSYFIRITWGPEDNKQAKTFHTVSTYWDASSVEKLFKERLTDQLTEEQKAAFENLKIEVKESKDTSRYGSLDFNTIGPQLLADTQKGLSIPQAYEIQCLDNEGNEHVFTTVKSTVPIDEYIHKLQISGFNNIVFNPVKKSGKVEINDINSSFKSLKRSGNFFQRFIKKK